MRYLTDIPVLSKPPSSLHRLEFKSGLVAGFIPFASHEDEQPYEQNTSALIRHSDRSIRLKHKRSQGYSAWEITRYQCFLIIIELMENKATSCLNADWFEIISECGYYDHSQLIHDFHHFLNLSPKQFL